MKESPIFTKTYDLLRWLIPATVKFPRQHRFVLATAVQTTSLQFQERLVEAARATDPRPRLQAADTDLTKLRLYLRLCRDLQLLSPGQYEHAARMVNEVGRLLGGWIKTSTDTAKGAITTPLRLGPGHHHPRGAGGLLEQQSEERPLRLPQQEHPRQL